MQEEAPNSKKNNKFEIFIHEEYKFLIKNFPYDNT